MTVAVIGGSGFDRWERFEQTDVVKVTTPYAPEPVEVFTGKLGPAEIMFVPRHGRGHTIPPHCINFRANIWALKQLGATAVLSLVTVGGVSPAALPGALMIPDQVLDYTYGRAHTYFDGESGVVGHVDMTEPYCEPLRARLLEAARRCRIRVLDRGTYAATQGPRFETPAEIRRLERDGADVVGMTGMPEAALAKELRLACAALAMVVNPAAGRVDGGISIEQVREWQAAGRSQVETLLGRAVPMIHDEAFVVPPPLTP